MIASLLINPLLAGVDLFPIKLIWKEMIKMKINNKYIPVIVLILFYLNGLRSAIDVATAENNISFIILVITAPLPFLIAIVIALIKLIKKES